MKEQYIKTSTEKEIKAALALVDFDAYGIRNDTVDWSTIFLAMKCYCKEFEPVNSAAARILAQAYRAEHEKNTINNTEDV